MAAIPRNLGRGGAFLTPGHGSPDLLEILDGIADDLALIVANIAGLNITAATPAAITGADPAAITGADPAAITGADPAAITAADPSAALGAFSDPPNAGEMAALRTLINELRTLDIDFKARFAEYNTLILDEKARLAEYRTLVLDEKARFAEYRTLILDVKARLAEYLTLVTELKTDVSAGGGVVLVTTKATS